MRSNSIQKESKSKLEKAAEKMVQFMLQPCVVRAVQDGYVIYETDQGGLKAVALDDVSPAMRQRLLEARRS